VRRRRSRLPTDRRALCSNRLAEKHHVERFDLAVRWTGGWPQPPDCVQWCNPQHNGAVFRARNPLKLTAPRSALRVPGSLANAA
jgi:hypothetical protein